MNKLRRNSNQVLIWIQDIGLLIIAIATIIAIGIELLTMIEQRHVSLADLLLLFIYLEILAMASIYLKSGNPGPHTALYNHRRTGTLYDSGYEKSGHLAHAVDCRRSIDYRLCHSGDPLWPQ